jgi:hypothetical protein
LNGDGKLDLAVANFGASRVSVLLGNGDGSFGAATSFTVGPNPRGVVIADLSGDGRADLAVANDSSGTVSVLLGDGLGSFSPAVSYTAGSGSGRVAVADLNGDGRLDLVTSNYNALTISVLRGTGSGLFAAPVAYSTGGGNNYPRDVVLSDMDGDGNLDAVTANLYGLVSVLKGNGDGTFVPATSAINGNTGYYDAYQVAVGDFNADGRPDLALAGYGQNQLYVLTNAGNLTFGTPVNFTPGSNPIGVVAGDLDGDGVLDLTTARYSGSGVTVYRGNVEVKLAENPLGSGLRSGFGRGNLAVQSSDVDYFTFSAKLGDRFTLSTENPGQPNASGLRYDLYRWDGTSVAGWWSDYNGNLSTAPLTLPAAGRYSLKVSTNYGYEGEYRFRVTLATSAIQLEAEVNDTTANANIPVFVRNGSTQTATVTGLIATPDLNGDYFSIGNLTGGTTINTTLTLPSSSTLSPVVTLYRGTSAVNVGAGAYFIPSGGEGAYYVRITAATGTTGLLAQYILNIEVADTTSPFLTSSTLPAEGTTIASVFDRFGLTFSEDMAAGTVNASASYDLRASGADNSFDTADDQLYNLITSSTYASGLSASLRVSDGPLQPGRYRFTATDALTDRVGNKLSPSFTRTFSVNVFSPFVLENRSNDSLSTASLLGIPGTVSDGSFTQGASYTVGSNPYHLVSADLNGDGKLDVVASNYSSNSVSVLLGNGDGTFRAAVHYSAGTGAIAAAVGDLNGDGKLDLAVANFGASRVSVLLGNGDGSFGAATSFTVGSNPRGVVIADLSGDGRADLAVANDSSGTVSVLLGDGLGSFSPAVSYTAGSGSGRVAVADLNGDGRLDLVTSNYNEPPHETSHRRFQAAPKRNWMNNSRPQRPVSRPRLDPPMPDDTDSSPPCTMRLE